jgi:hypothetical protein
MAVYVPRSDRRLRIPDLQYQDIEHAPAGQMPADEAHGLLCGLLCARGGQVAAHWLELIAEAQCDDADPVRRELLRRLHDETLEALQAGDMRFQPMLPDDQCGVAERAAALARWCQGFLYGLGVGRLPRALPVNVREILADFKEIARAVGDDAAAGEDDEAAWAELVEFVRVSVQLVFDELATASRDRGYSSTVQ